MLPNYGTVPYVTLIRANALSRLRNFALSVWELDQYQRDCRYRVTAGLARLGKS